MRAQRRRRRARRRRLSEQIASLGLRYRCGRTFDADRQRRLRQLRLRGAGRQPTAAAPGRPASPGRRARAPASTPAPAAASTATADSLSALHRSRHTVWTHQLRRRGHHHARAVPAAVDDRHRRAARPPVRCRPFPIRSARRQAVEAYIRATGLPPTLADSINYFSNRYFLQKQLRGRRRLHAAPAARVRAVAPTRCGAMRCRPAQADSAAARRRAQLALNDNVRQDGASAALQLPPQRRAPTLNTDAAGSDRSRVADHRLESAPHSAARWR